MKMGVGAGTMLTVRPEVQQRERAGRSVFQLCGFANENTARCLQYALKTSHVQLKPMGMFPPQHSSRCGTHPSPETGLRR